MQTRSGRVGSAVPRVATPSPVPALSELFSMDELDEAAKGKKRLLLFFIHHSLLRPLHQPCPHCADDSHRLSEHVDEHYTDGYRLQCSRCRCNYSPRFGSCFSDLDLPLLKIGRLLVSFHVRLDNRQAATIADVHRNTVSKCYTHIRERVVNSSPSIRFPSPSMISSKLTNSSLAHSVFHRMRMERGASGLQCWA